MIDKSDMRFLLRAIELSRLGMQQGHGGPFGCVIVRNGEIVGEGFNQVTSSNDPTAHAEVVAIREACRRLQTWQLTDCDVFTSCEPCPMCLGALYWARPKRVVFANTRQQAAAAQFDDAMIYSEIAAGVHERKIPFEHVPMGEAAQVFDEWKKMEDKTAY